MVRPEPRGPRMTTADRPASPNSSGARASMPVRSWPTATSTRGGNAVRNRSPAGSVAGSQRPAVTRSQTGTGTRTTHSERGSAGFSTTRSPRCTRSLQAPTTSSTLSSGPASSQPSRPMHGRRDGNGLCSAANKAPNLMSLSIRPAAISARADRGSNRDSGPVRWAALAGCRTSAASQEVSGSGCGAEDSNRAHTRLTTSRRT